ncbi:fibronectin type III domain-containing protein [Microscilla marina]|uniref:Ser/Thr protein phosphatase family protein n=1 Tax=Microscilla marina ATCC 23134 TaxID=313606 RepID=A1ZX61_MICM2|nr:fibronectin type III domain-containing protein [Microscilla marina]EAY25042.1 Ser/Thr protein phosphatase family protein [Microscilla marina ATCC 23134]
MKTRLQHLSVAWLLALFACAGAVAQQVKPYLQAAKPTSVWISWKTDNGTNPTVSYGRSAAALNTTVAGTTVNLKPKDITYRTPYHWHNVKLTGLSPNTGYYYQVKSGSSDRSAVHYFKTPPAYGNNNGKLRFIALGDHQLINYQGRPYYKFNELVQAAKKKAEALYGTPIANHINLIINDGDQVDVGTLNHYEKIHFAKQSYITPNLPLITAVGNHELYGSMGLNAYYEHFILNDNFTYQGINSGTERYYAYQMANVLFVVLDSELRGNTQLNWAKSVINAAKNDANVDWVFTIAHRPYQAEQYSNDYSPWYAREVLPALKTTDKFVLHIAGHHHLYARGQFKDHPGYHIISGGTAWPQYWGDSGNETDHAETQGSWSNFAYQIIEIDNVTRKMKVQSYTIGSLDKTKNNVLLDEFHLQRNGVAPNKPSIVNAPSGAVSLPHEFKSSTYASPSGEAYNSTQFQVSASSSFSSLRIDEFRHFENYYGRKDGLRDETQDIGLGAGIFNLNIRSNQLSNGKYYIRVRHRDKSLRWSAWSNVVQFDVSGSVDADPTLSLNKTSFNTNENLEVSYGYGPGNAKDWVGIYKKGQVPGLVGSTKWSYVNSSGTGLLNFSLAESGEYFVAFFENNGYKEIASRVYFWVGAIPVLSSAKDQYAQGEEVAIAYTSAPANSQDWIGIYKVGVDPAKDAYTQWQRVSGNANTLRFANLPKGYYYAAYHLNNDYTEIGNRVKFQVGTQITSISLDKTKYKLKEPINITFANTPGIEKDWLGIYREGDVPGREELFTYKYFDGATQGTTTIDGTEGNEGAPNQLPIQAGRYFIVMFTDDSYTEVSNRVYFEVSAADPTDPVASIRLNKAAYAPDENIVVTYANGLGNAKDWVGIYKKGDTPGTQYATQWKYVSGTDGVLDFKVSNEGEYFAAFFENNGYKEIASRVNFTISQNNARQTRPQVQKTAVARIYPNPVTAATVIEAPAVIRKVELFDSASGKLALKMNQLKQKRVRLAKHRLPAGNYLVKVYADKVYHLKAVVE